MNYFGLFKGNFLKEIILNYKIIQNAVINENVDTIHYFHRIFIPIIWIIKIKYPNIKIIYSAISLFQDLRGFFITADYYISVSNPVYNNLINFYRRDKSKVYKITHGINLQEYTFDKIKYLTFRGKN